MGVSSERSHSEDSSTSTSLIRRLQRQDSEAWERLVELYGPLVFHWCKSGDLSREDRADVFQEVFRAVARGIGNFTSEKRGSTFRGWLLVITQNKIRDHHRRKKSALAEGGTEAYRRLMALADPDADESFIDSSGTSPTQDLIRRALDYVRGQVSEQTWSAFWRSAIDGQASSDVADELGISSGAVRKAKARVLTKLRCELGDQWF